MKTQTAHLRYLHIAPRKVRLLASTLRGLTVPEAEAQLLTRTQRARLPLLKLIRSAAASAKHNQQMSPDTLFIERIMVDGGPILKRSLPRAQGRATPIHKIMSHVTVVLGESPAPRPPRFAIVKPVREKKAKEGKRPKRAAPEKKPTPPPAAAAREKVGFFRKIFRRKRIGE